MTYKPYPAYKDSGVEWLGKIPEGWECNRGRFCFSLLTEKKSIENFRIGLENIESNTGGLLESESVFQTDGVTFMSGDVLFGKLRPYLAKVWVADRPGEAVGDFFVMRPNSYIEPLFLGYNLLSENFLKMADGSTFGAKMPRVDWEFMANYRFPLPPLPTQKAIAAFLDDKTSRIDGLIKDYEELIALLREKRQALISHAVTRGLSELVSPDDPEFGQWAKPVKFVDSGVEWLGEIPEGWEAKAIKRICLLERGKFTHRPRNDPAFYDGPYPFIQTGDITASTKFIKTASQSLNNLGKSVSREFPSGTIVMAIAANIGDVSILTFPAYFPDSIVGFTASKETDNIFLFYLLQSLKSKFLENATVSTQLNINLDQIGVVESPICPLPEQQAIAAFLDRETAKLDALVAEAEGAVDLLKERRSALITAAVTGKIDVEAAGAVK